MIVAKNYGLAWTVVILLIYGIPSCKMDSCTSKGLSSENLYYSWESFEDINFYHVGIDIPYTFNNLALKWILLSHLLLLIALTYNFLLFENFCLFRLQEHL